jgi:hypothetical protein
MSRKPRDIGGDPPRIPIVLISDDVEGAGLIASLSRPGANTTGLTILSPELSAKRLEVLSANAYQHHVHTHPPYPPDRWKVPTGVGTPSAPSIAIHGGSKAMGTGVRVAPRHTDPR